jgi:CubicO group peptidase (beta-lactamase class C family)
MNKLPILVLAASLVGARSISAQTSASADSAGIRATALDYIEGWYAGDGARMERSLHPELAKRNMYLDGGRSRLIQMTAMSLVAGTRSEGGTKIPAANRKRDVVILDIYGNTASVRLSAATWIDYMHMIKWNGQWKIINVLWENEPGKPDTTNLSGLWTAKKRLGPDVRGPLLITRNGNTYTAEVTGKSVPVSTRGDELTFELPHGAGGFRGKLESGTIRGIWFQVAPGDLGPATPVTLAASGNNRWSGQVSPLDDEQTFHLLLKRRPDESLSALLRNLERDYGAQLGVTGLIRSGNRVALTGRRGNQTRDSMLITGSWDAERQVLTFNFPNRGGSYDFRRDDDDALGSFYPRGRNPAKYVYRAPQALDDGWDVGSVDDVGIDRAGIERAVQQLIDMSMDSINAPQVHSLLIVRRGKLVLEEYFHGEHRLKPHNVRSGSKSVTATLVGAAMLAGAPLQLTTPVYGAMKSSVDAEPRKNAMTLEHLLSMSSGYFCDDNNDEAPGNENGMWDQTKHPDFYQFALQLPLITAPGEKAVYCSINPNLALGMLGRATGESPYYLFDRLLAQPLGIRNYAWAMDRARNPYGGGGMALVARDYIKFGQLMLDSGVWKGKRILNNEFVTRATSPLYKIGGTRDYGLAWWQEQKPYKNRTVKFFAMLGNGGNYVMVFPELELIVSTTGGSYASRGWRWAGGELVENYVLPAVR